MLLATIEREQELSCCFCVVLSVKTTQGEREQWEREECKKQQEGGDKDVSQLSMVIDVGGREQ